VSCFVGAASPASAVVHRSFTMCVDALLMREPWLLRIGGRDSRKIRPLASADERQRPSDTKIFFLPKTKTQSPRNASSAGIEPSPRHRS
jgi:hypothetical protein